MKIQRTDFESMVIDNIRKLMGIRQLSQKTLAMESGIKEKALSKILTGEQHLSLAVIPNLASALHLREIDLITYPDVYVKPGASPVGESAPTEVLLQLRLTKEKKDQVLKLVFGENNIEILNK